MTASVMLQGVTSGAGKSTITALLCLYLRGRGHNVAPFKALNLSLNSYVTSDGKEIGFAQAYQAWSAGVEPEGCMNPILLKPSGEGRMQVVLEGRPYAELDQGRRSMEDSVLVGVIEDAFEELKSRYDFIVVEGSGSPVEINLQGKDLANMRTAELTRSPVLLVGDIDKGGVFAGLYGTYHLLEARHKELLRGFVINRFRGEGSILTPGIEAMQRMMSVPCLGVVPMVDLRLPEEDSLGMRDQISRSSRTADVRAAWGESFQAMLRSCDGALDLEGIRRIGLRGLG